MEEFKSYAEGVVENMNEMAYDWLIKEVEISLLQKDFQSSK